MFRYGRATGTIKKLICIIPSLKPFYEIFTRKLLRNIFPRRPSTIKSLLHGLIHALNVLFTSSSDVTMLPDTAIMNKIGANLKIFEKWCIMKQEHIMFRHIMTHLDAHNVLVDHQHGFRSNCSCETQIINTIEHLAGSINDRNQTDLLILDFSKAFDTVAHKRLLLKHEYYGVRGHHIKWMQSWLLNRIQQVVLEGKYSEKSNVKSGVPQGTVLGSLCFLLYIYDTGNNISSNLKLFADDTLLHGLVHNATDALYLQRDLDSLATWAQDWQMNLHLLMFFGIIQDQNPYYTSLHHTRSNTKGCRPPTLVGHHSLRNT